MHSVRENRRFSRLLAAVRAIRCCSLLFVRAFGRSPWIRAFAAHSGVRRAFGRSARIRALAARDHRVRPCGGGAPFVARDPVVSPALHMRSGWSDRRPGDRAPLLTCPASRACSAARDIQFFPKFENNVPNGCTTNAECGASGGQCIYRACRQTGSLCQVQADCSGNPATNTCEQLQRCSGYQEAICLSTLDCAGNNLGSCNQPIVRGMCNQASVSCAVPDYSTLAAPVAALPGAVAAVDDALAARIPAGQTPTHAALQGALASAKAHAVAHPEAVTAVILSTDGIHSRTGSARTIRTRSPPSRQPRWPTRRASRPSSSACSRRRT